MQGWLIDKPDSVPERGSTLPRTGGKRSIDNTLVFLSRFLCSPVLGHLLASRSRHVASVVFALS